MWLCHTVMNRPTPYMDKSSSVPSLPLTFLMLFLFTTDRSYRFSAVLDHFLSLASFTYAFFNRAEAFACRGGASCRQNRRTDARDLHLKIC